MEKKFGMKNGFSCPGMQICGEAGLDFWLRYRCQNRVKTLDRQHFAVYNGGGLCLPIIIIEVICHKQTVLSGRACQASGIYVCMGQTGCPYEV